MTLIERIEAAPGEEQREWLEQAFYALNPAPAFGTPDRIAWAAKSGRFHAMLAVEAWESAALGLVPADHSADITLRWYGAPARARLCPIYEAEPGRWLHRGSDPHYCANAATPALALCAACLRARESGK